MGVIDSLLPKVKANLVLEHNEDDGLLKGYIRDAVSYAESYQHIAEGLYSENSMPPTTEQAVNHAHARTSRYDAFCCSILTASDSTSLPSTRWVAMNPTCPVAAYNSLSRLKTLP